jgi:hypothetical protein
MLMLKIVNTAAYEALVEALDQYVMNAEDSEDVWHEEGDDESLEALQRLDEGRKMLDSVNALHAALAEPHAERARFVAKHAPLIKVA